MIYFKHNYMYGEVYTVYRLRELNKHEDEN